LPPGPLAQRQQHRRTHLRGGRLPARSDGEVLTMRVPGLLLTVASLVAPAIARADAATEAKLRDALRGTTSQLRALGDEKARWQKTEADLRAELETLRGQSAAAKTSDSEKRAVASLNRRVNDLTEANNKLRVSLGKCEAGPAQRAAPEPSEED